jgi:hypothetical protein
MKKILIALLIPLAILISGLVLAITYLYSSYFISFFIFTPFLFGLYCYLYELERVKETTQHVATIKNKLAEIEKKVN